TPALNYNGPDSFTFKANDGSLDSNAATVTISVTAVNDAPMAVNDSYTIDEDGTLTVGAPGVLGNDSDIDSATITAVLVAGPAHGTLTLNANGSFTYTPAGNYAGPDSFTYKANDGSLDSSVATVSITVTAVNDAPAVVDAAITTNEDTSSNITLVAADIDSAALTFSIVQNVAHGSLTPLVQNAGGAWIGRAPLPAARASFAVGVVNGIVYAAG